MRECVGAKLKRALCWIACAGSFSNGGGSLCCRAWGATRATLARTTTPASMAEFASAPTAVLSVSAAISTTRAPSARRVSTNIHKTQCQINIHTNTHMQITNWNANHYALKRTWLGGIYSVCAVILFWKLILNITSSLLKLNCYKVFSTTRLFSLQAGRNYFFILMKIKIWSES